VKGGIEKCPETADLPGPFRSVPMTSGWVIATVRLSSLLALPSAFSAAICRTMAWIDTFGAGSAMRSCSVKSATVLTFGLFDVRTIGTTEIPPTARTSSPPRVLSQIVRSGGTPAATKSTWPARNTSFRDEPPLSLTNSTRTSSRPRSRARFWIRPWWTITSMGR